METEWYVVLAVAAVGLLVGFINTLAGSGSLLSLPLLMFLGLPANVANGTNRIGILLQSLVAVGSFKQQKVFEWKEGMLRAVPAVVGAIIGAISAVRITDAVMEIIIGIMLVVMFFLLLYKPARWLEGQQKQISAKPGLLQIFVFFIVGLYGGFIQAGVGFFLLAGLVLSAGYNLVKANAIKVLIVLIYTPFALAIFIFNNQVNYELGLILGAGNIVGALLASKMAVKRGSHFVRYILLFALVLSALKLFGVYGWIYSLFS